jgi:uncharacterized membrane protein
MLKRKLYIAVCIFSSLLISCSKETVNNEVNTNKETCMQFMEKAADLTCCRTVLIHSLHLLMQLLKKPGSMQRPSGITTVKH